MSLWGRLFGKKGSGESKPKDDGVPATPPILPAKPADGGGSARPPAGAIKSQPLSQGQPKPKREPSAAPVSAAQWKARPIFISSTFKDMQEERDYLRSHVFPRLEEELRKRRHQLEPIDLRLGVETAQLGTEEARELLVLKVCLEEIQRSRPFLLVLLGDRYGWVPPLERMATAAQEAGFKADLQDKSVTALEIEFGVLKQHPDQRRRSFFYFRQPLPYAEMPPAVAAQYSDAQATDPRVRAGHDRLEALKQSLRKDPELSPHVHDYTAAWDHATGQVTGLEAWGEMVFQHLWKELDEETRAFAALPPPTEEAQERAALVEFAENRCRDFTGRKDLLEQLHTLATAPAASGAAWGACLTGAPGSGKSAVFAELFQRLSSPALQHANTPVPLVLANAAGGTPRGAQVDFMLRRFIQELADYLQEANPLPEKAGPDDVDAAFAALLTRAAARTRVVVLLDALDQFEPTPRGRHLTWLRAKQWPANARILATSLPCPAAEVLSQSDGVKKLEIPPLGPEDIGEIARRVWARYHRQVNPDVVRILNEKKRPDGAPAAANPLWLTLALEQLNLLDADDFARAEREFTGSPAERLRALLLDTARRLPSTVAELYGWLLDQTERTYGEPQARAFAALVAVSRFGWRESDLLPLVPRAAELLFPDAVTQTAATFDDLRLAVLRRGFRAHLGRRGAAGQLDFLHAQMRQAVRKRALGDAETVKTLHRVIADHLEGLTLDDPLRTTELMVHLIEGDDAPRAARVYAELPDPSAGLTGATQALARHIMAGAAQRPNLNVGWVTALLTQPGLEGQQLANLANRFIFDLDDALKNITDLPTQQSLLMAARQVLQRLALSDPSNAGWQRDLSVSQDRIGDVLLGQGDLGGALKAYRESMGVAERLALSDPSNAGWQRDLSVSHIKIGDMLLRQGDLGGALKAYRESMGVAERLAQTDPKEMKELSVLLSGCYGSVAGVLFEQKDMGGALKAYRESLAFVQRLVRMDPTSTAMQYELGDIHLRIGHVFRSTGEVEGALKAYRESLAIVQRLVQMDPTNANWQRHLFLNYYGLAQTLEINDSSGAHEWWCKAYEQISGMQQRGIMRKGDTCAKSIAHFKMDGTIE